MPVTLTRSILVVIIPALVALAPWALWVTSKIEGFGDVYKTYATLINASLIGLAIIVGSVFEGALPHLEVRWDKERENEYAVKENWFSYLAKQCSAEPVGFRYLSRMVTTMYFELSMSIAAPVSLLGLAVLAYDHAPCLWAWLSVVCVMLAFAAAYFFYWQAKCTHKVLCETRKEINARLA